MKEFDELLKELNFEDEKSIKNFIRNMKSGIYTGTSDGKDIIVTVEKDLGMTITQDSNNPNILKKISYTIDEDDLIIEEIYEPMEV